MLRVNGKLEEVSWEEALRSVAQRFEEIKAQYGSQSIGAIVSSRLTNEEYFLIKKLFKEAIGSEQIALDGNRSVQALSGGLLKTLGFASSTNSIKEIREADSILIIGADPAQTHPIIKNEIHLAIRRNKTQLIVLGNSDIDLSRMTRMSPLSPPSITLLTKPGEEVAMINGMIGVILREGLAQNGFLNEKTEGFEALRQKQGEYLECLALFPKEVVDEVEKAAKKFAQAKNGMILIGPGDRPYTDAEEIAMASSNLALLTGHIGKKSSGILLLLEKCNSQGAIDMGMGSSERAIENLLKKADEGSLKALYLIGKDIRLSSGALKNIELLAVQDLFMTGAAKEAHALLPACSFIEKSGSYTNLGRRIQNLHPLRLPAGHSKSDFDILIELLRLLEVPLQGETPEAIFGEISKTVPQYQGLKDGEQWPKGAGYLYGDGFPIGKAKLIPIATSPSQPQPGPYPFRLVKNISLFESGRLSLKSENLKKVLQKLSLEMNGEDAQSLKIENGEMVQLSTEKGGALKIKVKVSSKMGSSVIATSSSCSLAEDEAGWAKVEKLKGS
jgi:predicted molibdopterin-dependent oxidoreductase YjgC